MILTIIYFVFILGITVFIHEFGHFIFAKKSGVYVYEFSIGMGPKLFKFNRKNDETDYCIRLFPIGGYVQMAGEEIEVDEKVPVDKRLQTKKWYQRFLIMVAGVMMNFILAIVVLFIVALVNGVTLDSRYIYGSEINGLNDGDKIVSVNEKFTNNYDKLALELTVAGSKDFTIKVENKDGSKDIKIHPIALNDKYLLYGNDYGFTLDNLTVTKSNNNLKSGSIIKKVNGIEVNSNHELLNVLDDISKENVNKKSYHIILTLSDNDNISDVEITVKNKNNDTLLGYEYGFGLNGKHEHNIIVAFIYAFRKFFSLIEQMIFTIIYLFTGTLSIKMLSGPVGIFNVVGAASKSGFITILSLLALISVNVGFINLLPIPAFDGGHVLFLIIEKIKGSPVSQKLENTIHTIFLVLLMILMVYITFNDVLKLF